MKKVLLILMLGMLLAAAGCQIVDQERVHDSDSDNLPHNLPADWERNRLGIQY